MTTHKHHIVPKHAGGTDDSSNLVEVTPIQHAELHFALYLEHGRWQDYCAAFLLAGLMEDPELLSIRNSNNRRCQKSTSEANKRRSEGVKRAIREGRHKPVPPSSTKTKRDAHGRFTKTKK